VINREGVLGKPHVYRILFTVDRDVCNPSHPAWSPRALRQALNNL
jgi:hypothetical protein